MVEMVSKAVDAVAGEYAEYGPLVLCEFCGQLAAMDPY